MPRSFKQTPDPFEMRMRLGSKAERIAGSKHVRLNCYFADALVARVRDYAKLNGLSASAVVATAVQEFLARRDT